MNIDVCLGPTLVFGDNYCFRKPASDSFCLVNFSLDVEILAKLVSWDIWFAVNCVAQIMQFRWINSSYYMSMFNASAIHNGSWNNFSFFSSSFYFIYFNLFNQNFLSKTFLVYSITSIHIKQQISKEVYNTP